MIINKTSTFIGMQWEFDKAYVRISNNYSPKWRWLIVDIRLATSRLGKYPPLNTDTEVNSCFSMY